MLSLQEEKGRADINQVGIFLQKRFFFRFIKNCLLLLSLLDEEKKKGTFSVFIQKNENHYHGRATAAVDKVGVLCLYKKCKVEDFVGWKRVFHGPSTVVRNSNEAIQPSSFYERRSNIIWFIKFAKYLINEKKFIFYRSCIIGPQLDVKICALGTVINRLSYPADYCHLEGAGRQSQPMPIRWLAWESVLMVIALLTLAIKLSSLINCIVISF